MSGKQFLYVAIATFITVIVWVATDLLHSRDQIQPNPEVQQLLGPLDPNFDQKAIDEF